MKIIKFLMAIGIFACLFLPLSQCTSKNDDGEIETEVHIIVDSVYDVTALENIIRIISFSLPLIFCIVVAARKWKITLLVLQTVNHLWLGFLAYMDVWYLWQSPMWGGYLLTIFVMIYFFITIFEWVDLFKRKRSVI